MTIKFEPLKTREQIANELGISKRTLYTIIKKLKLDLPPRSRIPILEQVKIYIEVLGEHCLRNTEYEKYLHAV